MKKIVAGMIFLLIFASLFYILLRGDEAFLPKEKPQRIAIVQRKLTQQRSSRIPMALSREHSTQLLSDSTDFRLKSLYFKRNQDQIIIEGNFTGGIVDVRSIEKNILINDKPLSGIKKIQFNRKGTMFRLFLGLVQSSELIQEPLFTVSFKNVQTQQGKFIKNNEKLNVELEKQYIFEEDGTCYEY